MEKIRLYNVLDEYVNYLIQFDKKVLSCKEDDRKHGRKYLGARYYKSKILSISYLSLLQKILII